jgi:hypothetical protein
VPSSTCPAQLSTYDIDVPAGKKDIDVDVHTADASADNTVG